MATQKVEIKVYRKEGRRRKQVSEIIEVPAHDELVKIARDLREKGGGTKPVGGEYGECTAGYSPPSRYFLTTVDPFTNQVGETTPGGTIDDRCDFFTRRGFCFAQCLYRTDPPKVTYFGRQIAAIQTSGGEVQCDVLLTNAGGKARQEGGVIEVEVSVYERDPALRRACIAARGPNCLVCGCDFGKVYGVHAQGFIHVHHLESLAAVGKAHMVNPSIDLVPVCPNCHAVIHMRQPPFSPDEVRAMLKQIGGA
ncbi:MAG: hypothetical protein IT436_12365 [Phycisphaerales bacterium]|nr:hypothetical protein [Phycisphaerales bacterium]